MVGEEGDSAAVSKSHGHLGQALGVFGGSGDPDVADHFLAVILQGCLRVGTQFVVKGPGIIRSDRKILQ